jgi:hypothetical protein
LNSIGSDAIECVESRASIKHAVEEISQRFESWFLESLERLIRLIGLIGLIRRIGRIGLIGQLHSGAESMGVCLGVRGVGAK